MDLSNFFYWGEERGRRGGGGGKEKGIPFFFSLDKTL